MQVLESQNAILTNYEVYKHVTEQKARLYKRPKEKHHKGPRNFYSAVNGVLEAFKQKENPLSQRPMTYKPAVFDKLLKRLEPYDLSKGEMLMLFNLRPPSIAVLNVIIEDMGGRFTDEEHEDILNGIAEVLGQRPEQEHAEDNGEGDVSMAEAA